MSTYTATETDEIIARFRRFLEALDWHTNHIKDTSA